MNSNPTLDPRPYEEKAKEVPPFDVLKSQLQTKSALIRFLTGRGWTVLDIQRYSCGSLRYQHIRNVATSIPKRPREVVIRLDFSKVEDTFYVPERNEGEDEGE